MTIQSLLYNFICLISHKAMLTSCVLLRMYNFYRPPTNCTSVPEQGPGPHFTGSWLYLYRAPPLDMFKLVQLGPHCTGTPPFRASPHPSVQPPPHPTQFRLVHCEARTVGKWAVSIRLKCLLTDFPWKKYLEYTNCDGFYDKL